VGEVVTERFDHDGGRDVSVYVPPREPVAVLFAGDGRLLTSWGADLEAADLPPVMIVGVHASDDPDEMRRIEEYSPSFDPVRFAAHERLVLDGVSAWVGSRFSVDLPADRTAAVGVSAGAELALALGVRHPDRFGVVFAASPGGGYRPPTDLRPTLPRTYLTSGTLEPWFGENATRWEQALRRAGADVVRTEPVGDHGDPFWRAELQQMIGWAFA
jgi:enterochelin esterase-like enzyme